MNLPIMYRLFVYGFVVLGLGACASTTVKVKVEEPDFKVLEAAPGGRESWIDMPQSYAESNGLDAKMNYFYTAEAKSADKRMACEKARANVADDIAKQVAVFVDTTITRAASDSSQADTNSGANSSQVSEEAQRISSQLSKAQLSNVQVAKQYWERRDFSQAGGPKNIYYCWILSSLAKEEVNHLVARATHMRLQENAELKAKVEQKAGEIDKKYEEWQKTH